MQKLDHLYDGKMTCFSGIIRDNNCNALVRSTPRANSFKRYATAVLLGQKPILRSMAKRYLSLYACIISYSPLWVQELQATDKVSLFARKGDFLLCRHPP